MKNKYLNKLLAALILFGVAIIVRDILPSEKVYADTSAPSDTWLFFSGSAGAETTAFTAAGASTRLTLKDLAIRSTVDGFVRLRSGATKAQTLLIPVSSSTVTYLDDEFFNNQTGWQTLNGGDNIAVAQTGATVAIVARVGNY